MRRRWMRRRFRPFPQSHVAPPEAFRAPFTRPTTFMPTAAPALRQRPHSLIRYHTPRWKRTRQNQ